MRLKVVVAGLVALGGVALTSGAASAMPNGLANANQITGSSAQIEQVRWVCHPGGRCFWRPNHYGGRGYYAPPRHRYWHHGRRW